MEILNKSKTLALIKKISSAESNINEQIHQAAVSALAHYVSAGKDGKPTNDATVITKLVKAVSRYNKGKWDKRATKSLPLRTWVAHVSNLAWDTKAYSGDGGYVKRKKGSDPAFYAEEAIKTPFYEYMPNSSVSNSDGYMDLLKSTQSLATRIEKAIERTSENTEGTKVKDVKQAQNALQALYAILGDLEVPSVLQDKADQSIAEQEAVEAVVEQVTSKQPAKKVKAA